MMLPSFTAFLICLALVKARDTGKFLKTVPTISNSLVNLGKMEIAFYFNGKHPDAPQKHEQSAEFFSPPQAAEEACPCTNFKSGPSFLSDPTEMINKILKSNDLFKDPMTSSMCCGSHEHMQESTVFFELSPHNIPNFNAPRHMNNANFRPFFPIKQDSNKAKSVEILFYPKRKDMINFEFPNILRPKKRDDITKPDIQIVGDKDLSSVNQPSASVKKDLTLLKEKTNQYEARDELQTDSPPVTSVHNTL